MLRFRLLLVGSLCLGPLAAPADPLEDWVGRFNAEDVERYAHIPNREALAFLSANIPRFECPDPELERTYYFRWWTYRKHVRKTADGHVITEFLPEVPWARKHNTINCPAGHHFREGRWLHDSRILSDYARFYFGGGGKPRQYSFWAADSILQFCNVTGDHALAIELLDKLVDNHREWEKARLCDDGLFWQIDDRDGMEVSIGGSGKRATINSYMYGDADAIARIASMADRKQLSAEFRAKADALRELINDKLWCKSHQFYKTIPHAPAGRKLQSVERCAAVDGAAWVNVRELHGFTPWYFHVPPLEAPRQAAWRQLMDKDGFWAPFGPTTAEQRHPRFKVAYEGHECQWNGPSWPFATSIALTAMANVLHDYPQPMPITRADYLKLLQAYSASHRRKTEDGREVCWIDENLNPHTGDWISRSLLLKRMQENQGKGIIERGKDYNHSTFCDLVISGLMGLRVRADDRLVVDPLIPADGWDWCRLDEVRYHGHRVTIQWDRDGSRYGNGKGLQLFVDGRSVARSDKIERLSVRLP